MAQQQRLRSRLGQSGRTRSGSDHRRPLRLCRAGGEECVNGDRVGAGIAAVDNLAVPSPGEWVLRLWREDEAGNQQAANASEPVRLRFDPEPPQLGFEAPSVEDPTRVAVLVTDRISGLAGGGIEISRAGSGTWQVLPTTQEGDRLVTRIDDASLPAGRLRTARHGARPGEQPGGHRPASRRSADAAEAAAADRDRDESRRCREAHRRPQGQEEARCAGPSSSRAPRSPSGAMFVSAVGLVNRAGHPLADAKVLVYSRPKEGTEQLVGAVTTDASGRFSYPVEARASQTFRFVYPGTATILPIEDTATLLVKATSTFTVKPKRVQNGDSVTFSGRVKGRPLPEAGKLLELQVRFTVGMADVSHGPHRAPMAPGAFPTVRSHLRRAGVRLPGSSRR